MAKIPHQKISQAPPFIFSVVDQFGPFTIKDTNKGRRKCWATLYTCLGIKAIAIYAASVFMQTHIKFSATYGNPTECYSDHVPGAICGASSVEWEEARIAAGIQGTKWTFTEK